MRLPGKSYGVLRDGASVTSKYEFIDAEHATHTTADVAVDAPTIVQMCAWLGVSRSGFYDWRTRPESATAARRNELKLMIGKAFEDSEAPTATGAWPLNSPAGACESGRSWSGH